MQDTSWVNLDILSSNVTSSNQLYLEQLELPRLRALLQPGLWNACDIANASFHGPNCSRGSSLMLRRARVPRRAWVDVGKGDAPFGASTK